MTRNNLALTITLALNATPEEVAEVINAIEHQFGINNAGTVTPSQLVRGNDAKLGIQVETVNGKDLPQYGFIASEVATTEPAAVTQITTTHTAETDKTGMPWDERIHSSSKALNADGTWRGKRGVDAGFKTKIEASLRAAVGAVATPAAVNAPVVAEPATTPTPALTLPMPPVPGANAVNPVYAGFVTFIAANTNTPQNPTGRLNAQWVDGAINSLTGAQISNMQDLAHRPDLIPAVEAGIKSALGIA